MVLGKKVSIDKPEIDISGIRSNFELNENYIIFYMGGRRKYKRWSVVNFEKVSKFVELSYNYKIVLIGSDSDKSFSSAFLARHYSIDIGKTSLLDVMKIAANARVVLSNDSAIAHISAVAGTPTIVLVNGTHFGRFFPYPAEIGLNVYSIYPPEIMSKISEVGFLADKFRYRSNLDINLIEPQTVIEKIAKLLA